MANKFYVYELIDPVDEVVFYVGKGSGERAYQHAKDARAGKIGNGFKHAKIIAIQGAGFDVKVKFVATELSEREALRIERQMIHALKDTLTNIAMGNNPPGDALAAKAAAMLKVLPALDVWLAGWHPDCIKGFGGVTGATAFYGDMTGFLTGLSKSASTEALA